ncbi:hypothetical protein Q9966_009748 [Columba livia]|nr:hypothetical protein Q9966_009748 [Columba livia]
MAQSVWGYDSDNGPERWHENYPLAKGDKQSPIEINSKDVQHDSSLAPWHASYDPGAAKTILNNGRTCRVVFDDTFDRSGRVLVQLLGVVGNWGVQNTGKQNMVVPGLGSLSGKSHLVLRGGPLTGTYRLRQLHLHWGSSDDHGSEHVIDGVKYAAELHMVHWNPKHGNFAGALKQPDGVAVVGIFLKVGKTPKPEMKRILEEIDNIKTKGKEAPFQHFDPSILFPKSRDYWTYHGSFTTPPCEECITWILLREPIEVSSDQMAKLRSLSKNGENEPVNPLVDNWRPPQPVKGRVVKASFK